MSQEPPAEQTQHDNAVIHCSGTNRFGRPCLKHVSSAGEKCDKCTDENENPFPIPTQSTQSTDIPDVEHSGWTSAESMTERLGSYAHDNPHLQKLLEVSVKLAGHSKAKGTQVAYGKHWETFEEFRKQFDLGNEFPAPPEHVAYFIAFLTDRGNLNEEGQALSHGYIRQAVGAIRQRHTTQNLPSPTDDILVEESLEGYAKIFGVGSIGAPALTARDLSKVTIKLVVQDTELRRDRALCLLATHPDLNLTFGQLAKLHSEHIIKDSEASIGLLVTKRGGDLQIVYLPTDPNPAACPTTALRELAPDNYGPIFRNQRGVGLSRQGIHQIVTSLTHPDHDSGLNRERRTLDADERAALTARLSVKPLPYLRTRAVLLLSYWAALRGSETAALRWSDIKHVEQGIELRIRKAKNDQRGDGHVTPLPRTTDPLLCPVQAVFDFHHATVLHLGHEPAPKDPVFSVLNRSPTSQPSPLSVASVTNIVRKACEDTQLEGGPYTSHSLRAGFVTDAADNGATPEQIQRHGRWASTKSLSPYYRRANLWSDANPATQIAQNLFKM